MASTQESPIGGDIFEGQRAQESQPLLKQFPGFREVLSQENRTQSGSSIFVVVDGKEIPKPAKVPKDCVIEMVTEVQADRGSIDEVRNDYAVAIQDTRTRRGWGVFATSDFQPYHLIISEQPALRFWMPLDVSMANMRRQFEAQWCDLLVPQQEVLKATFPRLRFVPSGRARLPLLQSIMLYNFALEYSYSSPDGDFANIYTLASHINHACRDCANAVRGLDWDEQDRILITLVKPVMAGEEIFIHYNTVEGGKLPCAVCGSLPNRPSRCQVLRNKLSAWRSKLTRRRAEGADATGPEVMVVDDAFNADVPGPGLSLMDRAKRLRNKAVRRWGHWFAGEGCDWTLPWTSAPWQSPPRTPYPDSPILADSSAGTAFPRGPPPTAAGSPVRRPRART